MLEVDLSISANSSANKIERRATFQILMIYPTFSPEMMFRRYDKSYDQSNKPFFLFSEASTGYGGSVIW